MASVTRSARAVHAVDFLLFADEVAAVGRAVEAADAMDMARAAVMECDDLGMRPS
jgi:hypothetical protein